MVITLIQQETKLMKDTIKIIAIRLAGYTGKTPVNTLPNPYTSEDLNCYEERRINHQIDKAGKKFTALLVLTTWIILLVMMKMPT